MAIAHQKKWTPAETPAAPSAFEALEVDLAAAPASPVHAMHQLLSAKFADKHVGARAPIGPAARFSIVFYAGLGAWVALAIPVYILTRIW